MKATGIVRNVDELGRIVIPMELRRTLQIKEKDPVEVFTDGNRIVLQKYSPGCTICGESDHPLDHFMGKAICKRCISTIKAIK